MKMTVKQLCDLAITASSTMDNHTAFVESVANHSMRNPGDILFTGWKADLAGGRSLSNPEFFDPRKEVEVEEGDNLFECVAQWIFRLPNEGRLHPYVYVNVPGMEEGLSVDLGTMEIGKKRVSLNTEKEELHRLIEEGYDRLMKLSRGESKKSFSISFFIRESLGATHA